MKLMPSKGGQNLVRTGMALLLVAVLAAGCADKDEGAGLSEAAKAELQDRAREVRSAAEAKNRAEAEASLARLRTSVNRLRDDGRLNQEQAEGLLALAARVESALVLLPRAQSPSPTPSSTVAPREREPVEEDERGGDEGKGKGKGRGKGDD